MIYLNFYSFLNEKGENNFYNIIKIINDLDDDCR